MLGCSIRAGSSRALLLEYTDGNGAMTRRTVEPVALLLPDSGKLNLGQSYIYARCRDKRGMRQFRLDRVTALADARTGELLELDAWLDSLQLGPATPWNEIGEGAAIPALPPARPARRVRWIILALLMGYAIGRLRLIRMLLLALDQHAGLWL